MVEEKRNELVSQNFLTLFPLVSSLMVVGIHIYGAGSLPETDIIRLIEGFFSHGLFCAAVPVFFLMSGYLFFRNASALQDVFLKLRRRVRTLVIPYIAWSAFYYCFYAVGYYVAGIEMSHVPSLSLMGILSGVIFYEYCFPLWYLFQLILYTCLTPLIFNILNKCRWVIFILIAICWMLSLCGYDSIGVAGGSLERAIVNVNFLGYWLLGCSLTKCRLERLLRSFSNLSLRCCAIILALFSLLSSLIYDEVISAGYNRLFVPVVTLLYIVVLIKASEVSAIGKIQNSRLWNFSEGLFRLWLFMESIPLLGKL